MKKFANAEIEVVKFNNAVIATSGCTDITKAESYEGVYNDFIESGSSDFGEWFEDNGFEFSTEHNAISR